MKKISGLLFTAMILLSLFACKSEPVQDESPITMFIPLGNTESYYRTLAAKIKDELDIDVEFVYQINRDTSDTIKLYFEHNDLPADIVFTASKTPDNLLKDSCVDLMSRSSLTSLFTPMVIQNCTTEDGALYQLPVSSRLIGITYNETLLQEMGWKVPENFNDMLDLKKKCDAAGIKFAVSDGLATGHGFNWLFHLMGSQWISTIEGTQWLKDYQAGQTGVEEFKEQCAYFKKWTEAGLWGSFHNYDWNGNQEFSKTRALFWFGLVNTMDSYDGPEYDDNGNETGRELHDVYKSIPWLSEDGSNNCYTYYDNCWVYVDKKLEDAEEADKLTKVFEVIEYMVSKDITELVSAMAKDTYVSVNDYEFSDDRLYSDYQEMIKTGFIQPWYYNMFSMDSIVFTGEKINNYIAGTGDYDEIFTTLDEYNQKALNSEVTVLSEFKEKLDYENTAKLVAVSIGEALNKSLEDSNRQERAEVAIVPYTTSANMLPPWKPASVCNSFIYEGKFDAAYNLVIFPANVVYPDGIYLTGSEIKALVEKGFDPSDRYLNEDGSSVFDDEKYGPYPYVCVVKEGIELEDDKEYLVALSNYFLSNADYQQLSAEGKLLDKPDNIYTVETGLSIFTSKHPQIGIDDLKWQ